MNAQVGGQQVTSLTIQVSHLNDWTSVASYCAFCSIIAEPATAVLKQRNGHVLVTFGSLLIKETSTYATRTPISIRSLENFPTLR